MKTSRLKILRLKHIETEISKNETAKNETAWLKRSECLGVQPFFVITMSKFEKNNKNWVFFYIVDFGQQKVVNKALIMCPILDVT